MEPTYLSSIEDLNKLNLWRRYQSTLSFILFVAVKKLYPARRLRIEHSMSKGFYCLLDKKITIPQLKKIEKQMTGLINQNIPIKKIVYSRKEAVKLFKKTGMDDKVALYENIRKQNIAVYKLLDYYDSYITPPFESTGKVKAFQLKKFSPGFIMVFPTWQDLSKMPRYQAQPKLARIFNEYEEWAHILGISDIAHLNHIIKKGKGPEIIKITEALHEKKIVYIADRIMKKRKKIVLIAGPSSAGKTTFTKRLAIQLFVNGIRTAVISADDYFLPHSQTPKDEFGRLDFESIDAVDLPLLNRDLLKIIGGGTVEIPKFNFRTGRRNKGKKISLPRNGVILLEGIHCLNEKLTHKIPSSWKFKIYISALTHLNVDNHNRISTTDTRLLRRIVRDTHFRGYKIKEVLHHLGSIINGEEKNIYPYQEEADEMFNSALMYEPAVLKRFFMPIIKAVKKKDPEYEEAKRFIDLLNLFYELNEHDVPSNSILREFIGGSSFVY
ncbi:MAG TPA: nucleoside kinase [candidate division WOR-3 bacterium]|uniref:Nucleoside kinase n=1 Tax=candidate division WOR-3 bacterium TaxID=2052148 RepID=A0A9C9K0N9_UNCW3|nr:nucleoside kinase [candidate division WOR-3 bacterium]